MAAPSVRSGVNVSAGPLVWNGKMIAIARPGMEGSALRVEPKLEGAGEAWLRSLGDRELDRAYRLAGFILGNAADAEDVTQDALTRAWQRRATLRSGDSGQAWLDRILVNVCRDRLRRRRAVRWVSIEEGAVMPADPFAGAIAADALLRGLASLDIDHRVVVVLRFYADLPIDQIAERLDIPVGTVKSRLHYALRDLRAAIEPGGTTT